MHRFFLPSFFKDTQSIDDAAFVHQLIGVLRMKGGEEVVLFNGDGNEYVFEIRSVSRREINGTVVRVEKNNREPASVITLCCAILKRENFELVVQKATEVGVKAIIPLITERTVKMKVQSSRLKKIITEAAEQSGRAIIPDLYSTMTLYDAFELFSRGKKLFFDIPTVIQGETRNPVGFHFSADVLSTDRAIFIGPEGGWSDAEREKAQEAGCEFASLSSLTLRAETAAIIATYATCGYGL